MFESLTDRLSNAFRNLRGVGKLTEDNMAEALKEVRQALLSADVHFRVAREFINEVKAECLGSEVLREVTPGQQIIKIINDKLVDLLGSEAVELSDARPLKIMLVGLHGSGKTTTTAKLARHLNRNGYQPALVACDVYRPAAIDQLEMLADEGDFQFFANRESKNVSQIGKAGLAFAREKKSDAILFDTAGRLQIDEDLIQEIIQLKKAVQPDEVLLVADSALGQEAVNVANHFHEAVDLTGIILTKLDGDARGGAAISMKKITGVPIKFVGIGEKMEALERFHPDRMVSRILGMGDVVSLVEKAQETIEQEEAEKLAEKMQRADFNFEDFLQQMKQIKKMGSIGSLVGMMPGMSGVEVGDKEEKQLKQTEAIILSMTPRERQNPNLLNGRRRMRIANGSGVTVREVNQLIKQFSQMRKMMKSMRGKKGKRMMQQMQAMQGKGGGSFPGLPGL